MRILCKLYNNIVEFLNKSLFNVPDAFSNVIFVWFINYYIVYFFLAV